MQIDKMNIVVTGAASGMGRHFTLRLAELGASVLAADIDEEKLATVASDAEELSGEVVTQICNVADEDDVTELIDAGWDAFETLNGLVNNAGIFRDALLVKKDRETGEIRKMKLSHWQAVIDVDLTGPFLCTREFAAKAIENELDEAVVVNISSVSRHGNMGQSNYSAAKAGLVADTSLWAKELARYGIRVGAIAPGFVDTPILQGMRPDALKKMLRAVPLRRAGTTEEIFLGLKFILECDYFSGRCLDIDGGLTL